MPQGLKFRGVVPPMYSSIAPIAATQRKILSSLSFVSRRLMPAESALHNFIARAIRLFNIVDGSRVIMSRASRRKVSISVVRSGGREGRLHSASVIIDAPNKSGELQLVAGEKLTWGGPSLDFAVGPVCNHQSISFEKATTAVPDLPPGRRTGW